MKSLKILFAISLFVNLIVLIKMLYRKSESYGTQPYYDGWNATRQSIFDSLPIDTSDIVFVGNSITEAFPINEIYGPSVKNRGINGNTTAQVLQRIERIASSHPKKIFIEAGINDLQTGLSPDSIINCYRQIISAVKKYSVPLYVQSIFPVRREFEIHMNNINTVNPRLKLLCDSAGVHYIDVYKGLIGDKDLNSKYTDDGIHLNGAGCMHWKKIIDPFVK